MEITKIEDIIGMNLDGFELKKMTEICSTDDDGRKLKTVGLFHNPDIAEAFRQLNDNPHRHLLGNVIVLTNGSVGVIIEKNIVHKVFHEETVILDLREKALNNLDSKTRKILGL